MTSLELTGPGTADFSEGDVYFVGNATTLIRFGGLSILTDPAFLHKGEHVYLGHGNWARREVEPACQIADLPPIDLVVVSHYHGDHFDDVAAQELDKKLPIVSTADAVGKLSGLGFERGYPLDTWESLEVRKGEATLKITAMRAPKVATTTLTKSSGAAWVGIPTPPSSTFCANIAGISSAPAMKMISPKDCWLWSEIGAGRYSVTPPSKRPWSNFALWRSPRHRP